MYRPSWSLPVVPTSQVPLTSVCTPRYQCTSRAVGSCSGPRVPLLVEALALLLDAGLDPGRHIVAELGQGLVLRSGQAAVVLWRV